MRWRVRFGFAFSEDALSASAGSDLAVEDSLAAVSPPAGRLDRRRGVADPAEPLESPGSSRDSDRLASGDDGFASPPMVRLRVGLSLAASSRESSGDRDGAGAFDD